MLMTRLTKHARGKSRIAGDYPTLRGFQRFSADLYQYSLLARWVIISSTAFFAVERLLFLAFVLTLAFLSFN